ncbi:hypothetical protein [Microbacterium sp. TWP3-1-2b2]|uniref:hypothetical protein n=1 Tax=Microbacterium sp. TWP3-1-2b2 TaxID=2804651 RepID=UPI003CEB7290
MEDIDWNAEFAELAVYALEAEKATAEMMQRKNSIEREHRERGRKLSEHERLRQLAVRLCRRAGAKGVNQSSFSDRTKNQLHNIIREAQAVVSRNAR